MKPYIIVDWMNNHLFQDEEFETFEEGWEFIYENVQEEYEEDGRYEDYYVIEKETYLKQTK